MIYNDGNIIIQTLAVAEKTAQPEGVSCVLSLGDLPVKQCVRNNLTILNLLQPLPFLGRISFAGSQFIAGDKRAGASCHDRDDPLYEPLVLSGSHNFNRSPAKIQQGFVGAQEAGAARAGRSP